MTDDNSSKGLTNNIKKKFWLFDFEIFAIIFGLGMVVTLFASIIPIFTIQSFGKWYIEDPDRLLVIVVLIPFFTGIIVGMNSRKKFKEYRF